MTQAHEHPELRVLIDDLRTHVDGRFDLSDLRQELAQQTLEDVVRGQRLTNANVSKLQLWRAEITGTINGMKVAAGGARTIWLSFIGAISAVAAVVGATVVLVQRLAG